MERDWKPTSDIPKGMERVVEVMKQMGYQFEERIIKGKDKEVRVVRLDGSVAVTARSRFLTKPR